MLLTVVFLAVLLGAAALTLDVGSWYREQRQAQATADAAALAGAEVLPGNTAGALALAQQYADANGGGVGSGDVTFQSAYEPNDTVVVSVTRSAPAFFSKIFSFASVSVHAIASARAGVPDQVSGVAPIVVSKLHPLLSGPGCPCFHDETTLPLGKTGAPGAFGFVKLDPNANNGVPTLASWIQNGYDGYLGLGSYLSDPGAKFNAGPVEAALESRVGTQLLLPVYDGNPPQGGGAGATYNVIGWVAFHLDCVGTLDEQGICQPDHGASASLTGYFTRVIWQGLVDPASHNLPDFGVYSVSLVN